MTDSQLSIRLQGQPVGILEQAKDGKKFFTYDNGALMPLSISMPIRKEPYDEQACEAFFGGLLPESDTVRQLIGKQYGVNPHNSFSLLKAIGYDCAGAVSCHAMSDPVTPQLSVPLTGKLITEDELYQHIQDLPKKPLFSNVKGLKLSLAGVQNKAAVCLIDYQIALPENACPTTHILKPTLPHCFYGITENEYFMLKIAKRVGLVVPEVELRKIKDLTFLLIARYDRHIKNHYITRIHQEDFCQALGVLSVNKYQNEGGPGLKQCFEFLKHTTYPAIDRNHLASAVVFNYLIGNMDAHGKNFSLLHSSASHVHLAPFYDMVCTRVYSELSSKMAMKIGGQYEGDHIFPRHWQKLCEETQYGYPAMLGLIEKLSWKIKEAMKIEGEMIDHPIVEKIIIVIEDRIKKILKRVSALRA